MFLSAHPVARQLKSKESGKTVAGGLAALLGRVYDDRINTTLFYPLIKAIVGKKSNTKIWKAVLQLIVLAPQTTPPPTAESTYGGTPSKVNSSSLNSFDHTREMIEDALREELSNYSYIDVQGF